MRDSSVGDCGSLYRSAIARTKAAKPAADDASPAAVGKLFTLARRRGYVDSLGSELSACSSSERRDRNDLRQAVERGVVRSWGLPLRMSVSSGLLSVEVQDAVV